MRPDNERGRPGRAASDISLALETQSILTPLDDIARHVDGAFVVIVEVTAGTLPCCGNESHAVLGARVWRRDGVQLHQVCDVRLS